MCLKEEIISRGRGETKKGGSDGHCEFSEMGNKCHVYGKYKLLYFLSLPILYFLIKLNRIINRNFLSQFLSTILCSYIQYST